MILINARALERASSRYHAAYKSQLRKLADSTPRASNNVHHLYKRKRGPRRPRSSVEDTAPRIPVLGDHLKAAGQIVPESSWIHIYNIPPISSLEGMLDGIEKSLKKEEEQGIVDLDAPWQPSDPTVPFVENPDLSVHHAQLALSYFARPNGWYMRFSNRSIAYALLQAKLPVRAVWKVVDLKSIDGPPEPHEVTSATVRIENFPPRKPIYPTMFRLFSRCDFRFEDPVVKWHVETTGTMKVPVIYLAHFLDPAWARSAIRNAQEKEVDGRVLLLSPYPKQILNDGNGMI